MRKLWDRKEPSAVGDISISKKRFLRNKFLTRNLLLIIKDKVRTIISNTARSFPLKC